MSYTDFGLDDNKKAKDPGSKMQDFFCVFGHHEISGEKAYYLCFSNFVCCRTCLIEANYQKYAFRWHIADCDLCRAKQVDCYHGPESMAVKWTMCRDCYDVGVKLIVLGHEDVGPEPDPTTGQLPLF